VSINAQCGLEFQQPLTSIRPGAGQDWRLRAACRYVDPELFFPVSNSGASLDQVTKAKAVCAACRVRSECLTFAVRARQGHGIWGGMTEGERRSAAKREALRSRPAQANDLRLSRSAARLTRRKSVPIRIL
jgi:WhiB family transcriptional regulator, redox-sensing transcriptional regulator